MKKCLRSTLILAAAIAAFPGVTRAQCAELDGRFSLPGPSNTVEATAMFDAGSGPELYVGGFFDTAGTTIAYNIAKWNGTSWSSVGAGLITGRVRALTVFDDGSGSALYAGGDFQEIGEGQPSGGIRKWNGTSWTPVGEVNAKVRALAVYDDGSGAALYAAGDFTIADGGSANKIARWNGTSWAPLGAGIGNSSSSVYALTVFDDGTASELYAGGSFTTADGGTANHVALWNGANWFPVGGGRSDTVFSLAAFDDGSGAALYAGAACLTGGPCAPKHISRWNGTSWTAVGDGLEGDVLAMTAYDDGGGAALYAGGDFTATGMPSGAPVSHVAKWNGSSWSAITAEIGDVHALYVADLGSGSQLYVGGEFTGTAEIGASNIAAWDGSDWHALGNGNGLPLAPEALLVFDDGSGPALFACGAFKAAGVAAANRIAKYDGSSWAPLGSGLDATARALAIYDDGSGAALYAAGSFANAGGVPASRIAKWNGSTWSALGLGITGGAVDSMVVFDDGSGPKLYAAGAFTTAGGVTVPKLASWDGSSWAAVGPGTVTSIARLAVFDDGAGDALYACGSFTSIGGISANRIARWNGTSWSALGGGTDSTPLEMLVFDDGSGPALYVCGTFSVVDGLTRRGIAKWNGTAWSGVGASGTNTGASVSSMIAFDSGSGPALYAAGSFSTIGGVAATRFAKWDGASWSDVALDLETPFTTMAVFEDGADGAPDLYGGGSFLSLFGQISAHIAEWHGCPPGTAYCFGDGLDPVVTAQCPCSNFGAPGHGCANSNVTLGGARLWATGTTSPNTLLFTCEGINNNALATFWRGTANTATGGVVHDGIQCLGGTTIRFGQQFAGQLGNPAFTVSVGATSLPPGSTRYYQVLYRNPAPGFCPPGTYNFSNGYRVTW